MADLTKLLFVNANGFNEEAKSTDSVKFVSFKTANYELTDILLGLLANPVSVSAGAGDAGKYIVLNASGYVDSSMIDQSAIDHGSIGGLDDDDHTQYILEDGTRAFSGDQSMGSFNLTDVADPTDATIDAASNDAIPMSFLASTASGEGASAIGVEDDAAYYTGTSVESVLIELKTQIGGLTSTTFDFAENNVLADDDFIYPALEKLDLKWGDLASTANGEGASLVGIEDADGLFTATNVEAALAEIAAYNLGVTYTVGAGGVAKGDLVFISANNTVLPYATLSQAHRGIGLAFSAKAEAASVIVCANDVVIPGVLTGATAGTPYYWTGAALSPTIPAGSGSHVWQAGVAKNATDLHVEVRFIKVNA
jgi:hypothetical protein